jgi:hypothetical protein
MECTEEFEAPVPLEKRPLVKNVLFLSAIQINFLA